MDSSAPRIVGTAAVVALVTCSLLAQISGNPAAQVRAIEKSRVAALLNGDVESLRQIYANDYTLVTPTGAVRTKADQLQELQTGQLRYEKIEISEQTIRDYGDVVIVVSRDKSTIVKNGKSVGGDLRFTRVYKRLGHSWKLIATHASAVAP